MRIEYRKKVMNCCAVVATAEQIHSGGNNNSNTEGGREFSPIEA